MKLDRAAKILDQINNLVAELREITLKEAKSDFKYPQFSRGDQVLILSRELHHKEATVDRVRGEQMWHIVLDDGTEAARKYSSLHKF